MNSQPEIPNNLLNSIHQAFSDTIIELIKQNVSNESVDQKISLADKIESPLTKLAYAEYAKHHTEYGSVAHHLIDFFITTTRIQIRAQIKQIESTAITYSSLEGTPNKNYFCMQVDATKDGETKKFNFLLDLDLVKELLKGHFNPASPHILPNTTEFAVNGTHFKISHSVQHQKITLDDVREYVATSYVGSRVLGLFSRPTPSAAAAIAAPIAATGAASEEVSVVNNGLAATGAASEEISVLSELVRNYLLDANIISSSNYVLK